jgi:hypothetical protein
MPHQTHSPPCREVRWLPPPREPSQVSLLLGNLRKGTSSRRTFARPDAGAYYRGTDTHPQPARGKWASAIMAAILEMGRLRSKIPLRRFPWAVPLKGFPCEGCFARLFPLGEVPFQLIPRRRLPCEGSLW